MSEQSRIEPDSVVSAVEQYVRAELRDADRFSNRTPLDESGIYSLHALAARIYALGWEDGERATDRRSHGLMERSRTPTPNTEQHREALAKEDA